LFGACGDGYTSVVAIGIITDVAATTPWFAAPAAKGKPMVHPRRYICHKFQATVRTLF
jgi:hypothetical protein